MDYRLLICDIYDNEESAIRFCLIDSTTKYSLWFRCIKNASTIAVDKELSGLIGTL